MSADIEFLNGVPASNEACLHDAINRSKDAKCVVVMWINEDDTIGWTINANAMQALWLARKLDYVATFPDISFD
jgi:hypothetical protein